MQPSFLGYISRALLTCCALGDLNGGLSLLILVTCKTRLTSRVQAHPLQRAHDTPQLDDNLCAGLGPDCRIPSSRTSRPGSSPRVPTSRNFWIRAHAAAAKLGNRPLQASRRTTQKGMHLGRLRSDERGNPICAEGWAMWLCMMHSKSTKGSVP